MNSQDTLIHHLQGQADWQGTAAIAAAVPEIPMRTLRRWLAQLVESGTVERRGRGKITQYRWRRPIDVTPDVHPVFSRAGLEWLARVDAPLYTRAPVTYAEEWVDDYVPNRTYYLTDAQRERMRRRGKRPGIEGRAGTYIQKIYNRLLIDLSYNSSRLEGNTYTLADTERLLLKGIGAEGKLKEEQVMILNHQEAIRYLSQNVARLALNEETIRTLHYLLSEGLVAPSLAGQVREEGVLVSGTTYAPLEGRHRLSRLLAALLTKAGLIEDPFEQSFFLLGHLSYLQAFVDVNKRVARLACIVPLIRDDYVPQSFVDADKDDYLKATICFYEFNRVQPLAELYTWSYLRSCEHYDNSLQVLGFDEIAVRYRAQRRVAVSDIVRHRIPLRKAAAYVRSRLPEEVEVVHREKFLQDVLTDLENLDGARVAGLGIDRRQLQAWRRAK